jgi:hypothetical protein
MARTLGGGLVSSHSGIRRDCLINKHVYWMVQFVWRNSMTRCGERKTSWRFMKDGHLLPPVAQAAAHCMKSPMQ